MAIKDIPFETIDWSTVPATEHPGETGIATWRTVELPGVRARIVRYSPGYLADHWCERGHVVLVLEGELVTELRGGGESRLGAGHGYVVGDGMGAHRSRTEKGATLFIVD